MKRFIGSILVIVMVVLFAACASNPSGSLDAATAPPATATPTTSSTSRTLHSEPVSVNETYAKVDVVSGSTPKPAATAAPAGAETPATGDFPLVYFVGALGLILVCSGGLLMLRRI